MAISLGILSSQVDEISQEAMQKVLLDTPETVQTKARLAVKAARTCLAGILAKGLTHNNMPIVHKSEAAALMESVLNDAERLQETYGYTQAQALVIEIKELSRFKLLAEIAGDTQMVENIRQVDAHIIQAFGAAQFRTAA